MGVSSVGDVKIVTVMQRIDAYKAKELEYTLNEVVSGGAKKLICDPAGSEYISRAGTC